MKKDPAKNSGIKRLMDEYRRIFRIPENLEHYSREDYKKAERKFIKNAFMKGKIGVSDDDDTSDNLSDKES